MSEYAKGNLSVSAVDARNWERVIQQSGLPESICLLIHQTVANTLLWQNEKSAVARELAAHFTDALADDVPVERVIERFGDPKVAARLMRRAKKRNRPLLWRVWMRTVQAACCFVVIYFAAALLLLTSHPLPSVDYVAQINAMAAGAPATDRAWPIYREVFTELNSIAEGDLKCFQVPAKNASPTSVCRPDDPDWPAAVALIHKHEAMLAKLRQAAAKPYMGLIIGNASSFSEEDRTALNVSPVAQPQDAAEELIQDASIFIELPHLAKMRQLALMLCVDATEASMRGDGGRIVDDYSAMIGMARHVREHPIAISQGVGVSICTKADDMVRWVSLHRPDSLAAHHVPLIHAASAAHDLYSTDIATERRFVLDMIQRTYSDSGNGDGHLTPAGLEVLSYVADSHSYPLTVGSVKLNGWLVAPLAVTMTASRREATNMADRYSELRQEDLREPLWVRLRHEPRADRDAKTLHESTATALYYAPVTPILRSLGRFGEWMDVARAVHETTMVALALDVYRQRTGSYPDALAQLVPQYLPELPLDLSTGEPLIYKLKDGKPLLYGRGLDGKDDGGVWVEDEATVWPNVPTKGDWVLYPKPEPEESAKQK